MNKHAFTEINSYKHGYIDRSNTATQLRKYLKRRCKGRKLAWPGAWHENTKGTAQLRSFFINVDEGLKLGHISKVNIQTYVLRRCMLEGTRIRRYDYSHVLLHEEDEEIQHSQHDDQ